MQDEKNSFNCNRKVPGESVEKNSPSFYAQYPRVNDSRRFRPLEDQEWRDWNPCLKLLPPFLLIPFVRLCNKPRIAAELTRPSKRNKRLLRPCVCVSPCSLPPFLVESLPFTSHKPFGQRIFRHGCRFVEDRPGRYSLRQFQSASMLAIGYLKQGQG